MPQLRTDIVDVYIFRRLPGETPGHLATHVELLQLYRTGDPMRGTWQPVMGHLETGETAAAGALREAGEEVGLRPGDDGFIGLWALEQVHPYYIAELDSIVISPRFALEVAPGWRPRLNDEHTAERWVWSYQAERFFMWPGQLAAVREITGSLLRAGSLSLEALRVK